MKSDVLERLLIDKAAGQLSPDVSELLEAHLQHEPAARSDAAEIGETLWLARAALKERSVIPLPRPSATSRAPSRAWAMAACFVCGLSLGILAIGERSAPPIASIPQTPVIAVAGKSDFWSVHRLRAGSPSAGGKTENQVVWKSPVKKPEIL